MNPWIPGVEGNRYPIACQNGGIASFGQETPDMNNKITDVKTNTSIGASRVVIKPDNVMAKKIEANRYGRMNSKIVTGSPT
jgi:hypothetical protein